MIVYETVSWAHGKGFVWWLHLKVNEADMEYLEASELLVEISDDL